MSRRRFAVGCIVALVLSAAVADAHAQVVVTIDPTADAHAISPLIYGMNYASSAQISSGGVSVTRWGGHSTSRYNYLIDVTNLGADYYFENVPGCWTASRTYCAPPPSNPTDQSDANAFLQAASSAGVTALFTIPTIGWVARGPAKYGHPFDCGCPKSAVPTQDSFDSFDSNCGSGTSGGAPVTCPAPTTTSTAVDPSFANGWASYLVGRFGPSNGKRIYALDDEPALWNSFHHDVRPTRLGYDELWQRMRDYSVALLNADPTAKISGPAEWGWSNYFCSDADGISAGCSASSPDRAAHGGTELVAWLLDQAAAYEKTSGRRVLHYLDLHYAPQGGSPPEITRSLWDATYVDPSWIADKIRLIPRMRDWVGAHYPGTKIAISEYDFGHHDEPVGAITYAEVLGIFGREGVDLATAVSPPATTEAAFGAFKLFRNYDGAGAAFEATSVRATVSGTGVVAYAAMGPTRMTVVLVNEATTPASVDVKVGAFVASGAARFFTGNGGTITKQVDPTLSAGSASVTVPGVSFALLEIAGSPPAPADAGADASADSSAGDASTADGGAGDASTSDASTADSSAADASTADASTADASGGDSSAADASAGDTSLAADSTIGPDTGERDASGGGVASASPASSGCELGAAPGRSSAGAALLAGAFALASWVGRRRRRA